MYIMNYFIYSVYLYNDGSRDRNRYNRTIFIFCASTFWQSGYFPSITAVTVDINVTNINSVVDWIPQPQCETLRQP